MRKLILGLFVAALAVSARANPMLDKCLPFAPKICELTDKSAQDDFLSCFETVSLRAEKREGACAEEPAHARAHNACNAGDIPKLCAGIKPGNTRRMNCLRKNARKLGVDCRQALRNHDKLANPAGGGKKKGSRSGVAATRHG